MNEKVIEEIANQLGIAVDQASQFLAQIIPQYAGLQVLNYGIWTVAALILVIIAVVVAKIGFKKYKECAGSDDIWHCVNDEKWFRVTLISLTIGAVATVAFLYFTQQVAGWLLFPDAKVMEMVLSAVG